jgi:lipid II:glycine glycyltransferase (peptidoglycan interpeptide bridge formation enzyme)
VNINFDVPNVLKGSSQENEALKIFKNKSCVLSPRDQFAKANVLMDLTQSAEDLMAGMHTKHRYNMRYAEKKGVTLRIAGNQKDFDNFWELYETTSVRQKYYIRPKSYFQKIWDMLQPKGLVHILTAEFEGESLASWMLFNYDGVLYYPYGGSSEKHKNLFGSTYLGWQVILFGKKLGCTTFDMWGASQDPNNESDPWWGFTNFKLKYGGQYVTYMDSYDYVVNPAVYKVFSLANDFRWKVLKFLK